jgi:hypothetical protein
MYFYQHSPTCFGAYYTIFRKNFIVWSKLLLCFITDLVLYMGEEQLKICNQSCFNLGFV